MQKKQMQLYNKNITSLTAYSKKTFNSPGETTEKNPAITARELFTTDIQRGIDQS